MATKYKEMTDYFAPCQYLFLGLSSVMIRGKQWTGVAQLSQDCQFKASAADHINTETHIQWSKGVGVRARVRERRRENINLTQHDLLTGWKHSICLMLFIEGKLVEFSTVVPQRESARNKRLGDVLGQTCSRARYYSNCRKSRKITYTSHLRYYYQL